MIDCTCGRTFLNTAEQEAHAIKQVVLHGDKPRHHRIDHDGPSVTYVC